MAPKAQTQVPLLWWMSEPYASSAKLTPECVASKRQDSFSHDNVFHSLLGMFQIKTSLYQASKDMFRSC
jgi:lipid A ethanolaminephosphotransferase